MNYPPSIKPLRPNKHIGNRALKQDPFKPIFLCLLLFPEALGTCPCFSQQEQQKKAFQTELSVTQTQVVEKTFSNPIRDEQWFKLLPYSKNIRSPAVCAVGVSGYCNYHNRQEAYSNW